MVPEDASPPEAAATAAVVAGPLTPPSEEIPAFLDRRPLSAEDQRVFDMFMAAWNIASPVVRERIKAEVFGADASSRADAGNKKGMSRCRVTCPPARRPKWSSGVSAADQGKFWVLSTIFHFDWLGRYPLSNPEQSLSKTCKEKRRVAISDIWSLPDFAQRPGSNDVIHPPKIPSARESAPER